MSEFWNYSPLPLPLKSLPLFFDEKSFWKNWKSSLFYVYYIFYCFLPLYGFFLPFLYIFLSFFKTILLFPCFNWSILKVFPKVSQIVISFDDFACYFYIRHLVTYDSVIERALESTSFVWVETTIVVITPFVSSVQFLLQTGASSHLPIFALAVWPSSTNLKLLPGLPIG